MSNILIVDDDRHQARVLGLRLAAAGFAVKTVSAPEEAAELVLRMRPDAIILDIEMPAYSGLELHECLRMTERGRRIPVIYLSGRCDWVYRQVAEQQGAYAFLSKPYEATHLIETVQSAVAAAPASCRR